MTSIRQAAGCMNLVRLRVYIEMSMIVWEDIVRPIVLCRTRPDRRADVPPLWWERYIHRGTCSARRGTSLKTYNFFLARCPADLLPSTTATTSVFLLPPLYNVANRWTAKLWYVWECRRQLRKTL